MKTTRTEAIGATLSLLAHLRDSRPVWTYALPSKEGYYWTRAGKGERPEVVEVRVDYSERETPFVVQSGNPASVGVQYLRDCVGHQWCGPLEMPENQE